MKRREFIKLTALVSASLMLNFGNFRKLSKPPVQTQVGNRLYKGTSDGEILISQDYGKSWELHTRFSQEVSVNNLAFDSSDRLYARLQYSDFKFHLKLANDGQNWITV